VTGSFGRAVIGSPLCRASIVLLAISPFLSAQTNAAPQDQCDGVLAGSARAAEIRQSIRVHATVAAYDALGSLYARAERPSCAEAAFHSALSLDPGSSEARYNLALALRLERRVDAAKGELQVLLAAHPDFALGYEELGEICADEKDYEQAARNFETALHLDERLTTASEGLVQASLAQGRPQAAEYWAKRALALNPPAPAEYQLGLNLGIAQGQAADYDDAEKTLRSVTELFPDRIDVHMNLGIIEMHLQHYPTAIDEFSQALKLDANRKEVRLALAQAFLLDNRPEEALGNALQYNKLLPSDAEGLTTLARAYQTLNDDPHAIADYRQSLALRPGDYDTLFGLGISLVRTGSRAEALASFRSAERAAPAKPAVHYQIFRILAADKSPDIHAAAQAELAEFKRLNHQEEQDARIQVVGSEANANLDQGDAEKAAALYRQVLERNPNDADNHFNLSLALARLNDREGEVRELHIALALDPRMTRAYNRLGLCEEQQGHFDQAARDFQTVLQYDPGSTDAKVNLATAYGKEGQFAQAEALLRDVLGEHPDSLAAQLNLGLVLSSEKRWQEALVPLEAAAQLELKNPQPLTLIGIVYGKMGESSQSIEYLRKALALSPNSADAHLNLGIALADGFDLPGASEQFAAAEKLAPDSPIVHYNAGRVAFDQGDATKARLELERACALVRDYPSALTLLAQIEIREREFEGAIHHLSRVIQLQPQNTDAVYLLGRALAGAGRKQEAMAAWQQGLQTSPEDTRLLWALAHDLPVSDPHHSTYLARLKEIQGSEHNADLAKTLANLAMIAAADHEWEEAVAKMSQAIDTCQHCSIEASLQQNLGLIYAQHGQFRKAEEALKRCVQIEPDIPRGKEELATVEKLETHPPTL